MKVSKETVVLRRWSFFSYKDRINSSQLSKIAYKASCWDCQDFYIGKIKRRLYDRKTEAFQAITSSCRASAIVDHVMSTCHNLKWDHFAYTAEYNGSLLSGHPVLSGQFSKYLVFTYTNAVFVTCVGIFTCIKVGTRELK